MVLIGHARVATQEQNTELQVDALERAGCDRLFVEKVSGAQRDRSEKAALASACAGDTIVVWKLDQVARSLSQLIATFDDLDRRAIGLRSLTEAIDTTTSGGKPGVPHLRGAGRVRALDHPRADDGGAAGGTGAGTAGRSPQVLSATDIDVARALLRDGTLTVSAVAGRLG